MYLYFYLYPFWSRQRVAFYMRLFGILCKTSGLRKTVAFIAASLFVVTADHVQGCGCLGTKETPLHRNDRGCTA